MKKISLFFFSIALAGCLHTAPRTQPTPPPSEAQLAEWTATCTAIWREELDRVIDPDGLAGCIEQAKAGGTAETIREHVQMSQEYKERVERLERERIEAEEREKLKGQLRGRLRAQGMDIVDEKGQKFFFVAASELTILLKSPTERDAILDLLKAKGFNGLRVFAGQLNWSQLTQTPAQARAALPDLLVAAAKRGIYVQVTAVTDSRQGYDVLEHIRLVAAETAKYVNVIFEAGNELYHGTQNDLVNNIPAFCAAVKPIMAGYPNLWALGTGATDHPVNGRYDADCGTINTVHASRGGSEDDMIATLTGLAAVMHATNKPVLNSEHVGAGEHRVVGSGARIDNPVFFGRMAKRSKSYGFGSVFHSEDGLFARPWGPRQTQAAEAFVNGYAGDTEEVPAPTVPDTCEARDLKSHLEVLQCERDKYFGTAMSDEQIVDFLRHSAQQLNARGLPGGPFGILIKTGGARCHSNGTDYSCDIICSGQGAQQRQWDAITAVHERNTPAWGEVMRPNLAERPCEIVR